MAEELIAGKGQVKRLPLGIKGLDDQMEGGIPIGSVTLVCGAAGSMKSSICFNAIYYDAQAGNNVLYISLEQGYASLLNQMINLGYDFDKVDVLIFGTDHSVVVKKARSSANKGRIILSDLATLRSTVGSRELEKNGYIETIHTICRQLKQEMGISTMVLDSLNSLYVLADIQSPRKDVFNLFSVFRELGITALFISEMPKDGSRYSQHEIEDFLADGVIVLQLVERNRKVFREIKVVKMRTTRTNIDVFSLEFENGMFKALYGGKMPLI